jgi:hypothetical protein
VLEHRGSPWAETAPIEPERAGVVKIAPFAYDEMLWL